MDFLLRCNHLKCRTPLNDRAVVTTCSHIFCENCTDALGLSAASHGHRNCPACQLSLSNPDDVVVTTLNPSEDYKTSILSGLSPSIIMECAGRGLAFWSYQSTQEIVYQEYMAKTLTDKLNGSKIELDHVVNQANAEIDMLNQKLQNVTLDNDRMQTENQGLAGLLKERTRKHMEMRDLYERLKHKQMTAATQYAARSAAYESIEDAESATLNEPSDAHTGMNHFSMNHSNRGFNNQFARDGGNSDQARDGMMMPPPPPQFTPRSAKQASATMTPNRSRLGHGQTGPPGQSRLRTVSNNPNALHAAQSTPRHRQPLNRISPNGNAINGVGMSAGLKVGRQTGNSYMGSENVPPAHQPPRYGKHSQQNQQTGHGYI